MMMSTHASCLATMDLWCRTARCVLWQGKMSVVTRQDVCCGKTQGNHKGGRPKAASLVSCHNRGLVLSQQRSCLATAHIFSCRTRYPSRQDTICVSPSSFNMHHPSSCMHHTRCIMHHLLTTRKLPMFFGHNSTLVAPFGASMGAK